MNIGKIETDESRASAERIASRRDAERDARRAADREIVTRDADAQTANAVAKIRRDKAAREKRFAQWDAMVESDEFGVYCAERGYSIREAMPPMPRADEAEFAAIGALMQSNYGRKIAFTRDGLHSSLFRMRAAGNAFYAIGKLRQKARQGQRISVDMVTVASEMRALNFYDEGTPGFLKACLESCPGARNIRAYIAEIRNASRLRYLFWLSDRLAETARGHNVGDGPHYDAAWIINLARNGLDEIENNGFARLNELWENSK